MLGIVLNTVTALAHLFLNPVRCKPLYPHFTDEKIEAERSGFLPRVAKW